MAHLDVADLNLGDRLERSTKPTLTTDEVFLGSSVDGMRKHNMIAAMAFRKTEIYQRNVQDCAKKKPALSQHRWIGPARRRSRDFDKGGSKI